MDARTTKAIAFAGLIVTVLKANAALGCEPGPQPPISRPSGIALFIATVAPTRADHLRVQIISGGIGTDDLAGSAVLVPWSHGADCKPLSWDVKRDGEWSPPRGPAAYTGWLRPRDRWIDGMPTVDVAWARFQPLWWPAKPEIPPFSSGERLLTTADFVEFYATLPTDLELNDRQPQALLRVQRWVSEHKQAAASEPARSMLARLNDAWAAPRQPPFWFDTPPAGQFVVQYDAVRPEHQARLSNETCSLPVELPQEPEYSVASPSGAWSVTVQRTDGARVPYDQARACIRIRSRSGRLLNVTIGDRTTSASTVFREVRLQWINDRLLYIFMDVGHAAGVGQLLDVEDGKWLYAKTEYYFAR